MTPPLLRPFGQPHGGDLSLSLEPAHHFRPTPEFQAFARSLLVSRELSAEQGRSVFSSGRRPHCAEGEDCRPDLSELPAAVAQTRAQARSNPTFYRLSLNFLAAQFMNTEDAAARGELQIQAREIAREALDRVSDPEFRPPAEDAHQRELPVRTRARMLFQIASTLSALLAQSGSETYSQEDRQLLRSYFVRIRSLVEELRERKRLDSHVLGWPEYFDHYLQAQIALIDGQNSAAFGELLRTRRLLNELPAEARTMPLPTQLRAATELALQSLPRTGTGLQAEGLRHLISIECLGFVDQGLYLSRNGESSAPQANQRSQALSLLAAAYLQAGHASPDVRSLLQHLSSSANAAQLREIVQGRLRSDAELRNGLASLFPGDLNEAETRNRVAGEIVELARNAAGSILAHASEEPYRTIFAQDRDSRPVARAIEALDANSSLGAELRSSFGFEAAATTGDIVRDLVSHGENLPALLEATLPQASLNAEANRSFFRELRQAALGLQGDGMRLNLEQPLLDMVESVHGLAQSDDANAAAYFAIFQTLSRLEQVGGDHRLPPALRRIAENHAAELQNFSAGRVFRHLTAPSSLGMMAGGLVLSELAPLWLLRGARIPFLRSAESAAAVRGSGEMGILMHGGRLTGWGEAVAGLGVGLAMHVGSLGAHVVHARGTNFSEYGQELQNLGLLNLALGTVFSMAALGATMGAGHWLRGRMLPAGAALPPGRLALGHVGLRLGNWTVGGFSMLGAHMATAAISGHSAMPTGEQAAEVFLSMAMWDAGAAGLRATLPRLFRSYWRHQAGPFQVEQMVRSRLSQILSRNPELSGSRNFIRNYLRSSTASGEFLRISRALEAGRMPRIEGRGDGRRLVFGDPPAASVPAEAPVAAEVRPSQDEPLSRTAAARTVMDLTERQQTTVRQILGSSAFNGRDNPNGIHVVRQALSERPAADETNPVVWARAELHGRHLSFEVLPGEPSSEDRSGTFQMGANGKISRLTSEDPVLRAVIAGYNVSEVLSPPILPPSAGAESISSQGPEEPTAAHRRPVLQADTAESEAPVVSRAPEEIPSEPLDDADDSSSTAPRRPTTALIDAARRTSPGISQESISRPERRDTTVRFSTEQERRARRDSRPEDSIPAPAEPSQSEPSDAQTTLMLSPEEGQQLRERLGPALRPEGAESPEGPRQESQPPMEVREGELREEIDPIPDRNAETDFSGVEGPPAETAAPRSDSTPTIVPPAQPARAPVQPPPLPSQRRDATPSGARGDLQASISRGSMSAEPFLLLRRRISQIQAAGGPTAEDTSAVQVAGVSAYENFVSNVDRFILELFRGHREAPVDQQYFDIEVLPNGEMHVIDGALMFRYDADGYSYLSLFRNMPDSEAPHRVEFHLDRIHLSDEHHAMGWESYFEQTFPRRRTSQRQAP